MKEKDNDLIEKYYEYWDKIRERDFRELYKIDDGSDMSIERERMLSDL